MKRYIIIPFILSILWHGLFFGLFRPDVKAGVTYPDTQLFLITREQFDYLRKGRDIILPLLPKSLSMKNPLWKDTLELSVLRPDAGEDGELLEEYKDFNFQRIQISPVWYSDFSMDITPVYGDLFFYAFTQEKLSDGSEYIVKLKNNKHIGYFIKGPAADRRLFMENTALDIGKNGIKARFRFWVTRDGRVNQVIVEEGSSFPLIDSDVVNFIKTWRFNQAASDYEWGVVRIRILK